ncbi:hypothetical protein Tco_0766970 [Tanacetum coccineum]
MSKYGHENQKSTKRSQRIKAEARKVKPQSKSAKKSQSIINCKSMGSGSGPARASCAFSGSETGMLTPDVTVDVSTFHLDLFHPLEQRLLFSLSVSF